MNHKLMFLSLSIITALAYANEAVIEHSNNNQAEQTRTISNEDTNAAQPENTVSTDLVIIN